MYHMFWIYVFWIMCECVQGLHALITILNFYVLRMYLGLKVFYNYKKG